jgi:hypothetical protein
MCSVRRKHVDTLYFLGVCLYIPETEDMFGAERNHVMAFMAGPGWNSFPGLVPLVSIVQLHPPNPPCKLSKDIPGTLQGASGVLPGCVHN